MKYLIYLSLISIIFSCTQERNNQVEMTIDELIGFEEDTNTDIDSIDETPIYIIDSSRFGQIVGPTTQLYDTLHSKETTIFDRFKTIDKKKLNLFTKDSLQTKTSWFSYEFTDTSVFKNALLNWLDCFGINCIEVQLGENLNDTDEEPIWVGIFDSKIIIIEFSKNTFQKTSPLIVAAKNLYPEHLMYEMIINNNHELNWLKKRE